MAFPPSFLDELRTRVPVSEVVRRRVSLKKQGREWRGLSPFNKERTPSFFVNDEKGFYHCFSSGEHGDQFGFLMKTEGLSFPEAVERVADMAGIPVPKSSPEAAREAVRAKTLHDVLELAAAFFEATLASRTGAKARGYLADRSLSPATQLAFRLGYAPADRHALKEHLGKAGVPVADMVEAGLLIAGDDIPVPYDRFRDRVMFPITDLRGRVIAFGGRALDKDAPAKYLNSPETPLFHKGATLYNAFAARKAAAAGAPVIAVEGYVDVIAMVTAGFGATVAPLGTALTEQQLDLLWRLGPEPVLLFDGDKAGRRAAWRALDVALPRIAPERTLRFATLPEGQDPDDLVRAGGSEAMADVLAGARPLVEVLWQRETETGAFDTPERRAALEGRLEAAIGQIGPEPLRRAYRDEIRARLQRIAPGGGPRPSREGRGGGPGRPRQGARREGRGDGRDLRGGFRGEESLVTLSPRLAESPLMRGPRAAVPRAEAVMLEMLLAHPWLVEESAEEIAALELRHPDAIRLKDALVAHAGDDPAAREAALAEPALAEARARVMSVITTRAVWTTRPDAAREDVETTWKQLVTLHRQRHTLIRELREAERALSERLDDASFAWLKDVKDRLAVVEGTEASLETFGVASGRPKRTF